MPRDVPYSNFNFLVEFSDGGISGGFSDVWRGSDLFTSLREPSSPGACASCGSYDACQGGCMAAKFFTGLPMDGPDPECIQGYSESALTGDRTVPAPSQDHSRRTPTRNQPVLLQLGRREDLTSPPVSACAENPLAGFRP